MSQDPDAFQNTLARAAAAENAGSFDEAAREYESLAAVAPQNAELLCLLGHALLRANEVERGSAYLEQSLQLKPAFPAALNGLGLAQRKLGKLEEALASFAAAARTPGQLEALCNYGDVLFLLNRREAAVQAYVAVLSFSPRYLPALVNLGAALYRMRRYGESAEACREALSVNPASINAFSNLGNALAELDRPGEALSFHNQALTLAPEDPELLSNLGNTYLKLNRVTEALACFQKSQKLAPSFREAVFLEGTSWLRLGNGAEGWWRYEYRLQEDLFAKDKKPRLAPGVDLQGKTVLLELEEGLGDAFQFLRFLPELRKRGARLQLELTDSMRGLVSRTFPYVELLREREGSPDHDYRSSLMSLPFFFQTDVDSLPATGAYLNPPPERLAHWRDRLGGDRRPRVGLVWAGHPKNIMDHRRSMPLATLRTLFEGFEGTLYRLQKDCPERDRETLEAWTELKTPLPGGSDFDELAALVCNLDLVVAVDTSLAHLSGALARKTWILLAHSPDWRWLEDRSDTPWYPNTRLFRQPSPGDWASTIAQARVALRKL